MLALTKATTSAAIQYVGDPGSTQDCLDSIIRLLQSRAAILSARLLTEHSRHAFLLTLEPDDLLAVKSGFTSGYNGEGPRGLSHALSLLHAQGVEIDEYPVGFGFMERLDQAALSRRDMDKLTGSRPVRSIRWMDYIHAADWERRTTGTLWQNITPVIPLAIIERRIFDLALRFWESPDEQLLIGYRRLEGIVRKRTGIDEHGAGLFSKAFLGDARKLTWKESVASEQAGRATLFTASYMAYRNPRAHREPEHDSKKLLREFLLLNQLYCLEAEAQDV